MPTVTDRVVQAVVKMVIEPIYEREFAEHSYGRSSEKPFTRRTSGQSISAIAQKLRPKLQGFYNYFKHARASALAEVDRWIRVRLRSILRKRAGRRGKGRGLDHHRWPNSYFASVGLFNLEEARKLELKSLR